MHRDAAYARRALEAGAAVFVLKHSASAELVLALRAALQGRNFVSPDLATELMLAAKNSVQPQDDPVAAMTQPVSRRQWSRRHSHGATGCASDHSPRRAARASSCAQYSHRSLT